MLRRMESDDDLTEVDRLAISVIGNPVAARADYDRAQLAVQAAILGELRELRKMLAPVAELLPEFAPRLRAMAAAGSVIGKLGRR